MNRLRKKFPLLNIYPPEILQHVFFYLPISSYGQVVSVNWHWGKTARDLQGPFGQLCKLIIFYNRQKQKLQNRKDFNEDRCREILNAFRIYAAEHLEPMPFLPRRELLKHVFKDIQGDKYIQYHATIDQEMGEWQKKVLLKAIGYEGKGKKERIRSAYLQLAFLRSCYSILTPKMRKWLSHTSTPDNMLFQCRRFASICNPSALMNELEEVINPDTYIEELGQRGKDFICDILETQYSPSLISNNWENAYVRLISQDKISYVYSRMLLKENPKIRQARKFELEGMLYLMNQARPEARKCFSQAIKLYEKPPVWLYEAMAHISYSPITESQKNELLYYFKLAFENDQNLPPKFYDNIIYICFKVNDYKNIMKVYTCALEREYDFDKGCYLTIGVAAAKLGQLEHAETCLKKFIDQTSKQEALQFNLSHEKLQYIEKILTDVGADEKYLDWIQYLQQHEAQCAYSFEVIKL
jgi:hypothetical protein